MKEKRRRVSAFRSCLNPDFLIGKILEKLTNKRRFDWYEVSGDEILRHSIGPNESVRISEILSWRVEPEMLFDMVEIDTRSGNSFTWLDYYDDLKAILHDAAADLHVNT